MIKSIKTPVFGFMLTIAASVMMSGCVIHVNAKDHAVSFDSGKTSYSSTNKGVSVPANTDTGRVKSVNGRVEIDDHVTANKVSNVNGKIEIGEHVSVREVSSVNGKISIEEHFKSSGDVSTVNGSIKIEHNGHVAGHVKSVNGMITLQNVVVDKDITTTNGSIKLTDASRVAGDIIFKENNNTGFSWNKKLPSLFISADSSVSGNIILMREVELEFEDRAMMDRVKRKY